MPGPTIIDLYPCETDLDSARVYRPPMQALAPALIGLASKYPGETLNVLTVAAWATLTGYFIYEAFRPTQPRRRAK